MALQAPELDFLSYQNYHQLQELVTKIMQMNDPEQH